MKAMMNALLNVRPGPRPDPLPDNSRDAWAIHAPYMISFLAVLLCGLLMDARDFGLAACGAGLGAIVTHGVQRSVRRCCVAAHYSIGLLLVALFVGAEAAGSYAFPAGLFLVLALGARAAATYFTPAVAPLAGRVPWRFEDVYREQAKRFGIAGVTIALALVAFSSSPAFKVLGIAVLPMSLRSYSGQMLSPTARRKLWMIAAAFQAVALLVLVPTKGMLAAPWLLVVSETVLFVGTALVISERSGITGYSRERVAAAVVGSLLLGAVALPGSTILYILLVGVFAALVGIIWLPRKAASRS